MIKKEIKPVNLNSLKYLNNNFHRKNKVIVLRIIPNHLILRGIFRNNLKDSFKGTENHNLRLKRKENSNFMKISKNIAHKGQNINLNIFPKKINNKAAELKIANSS
jgi:hypothetical protein